MSLLARKLKEKKKLHSYFINYLIPNDKKVQVLPLDADNINMALIDFNRNWSNGIAEVVSVIKFK